MEQSVVITFSDRVKDEEGNIEPPGLFCYLDEYPEEGCIPLLEVKGTI